VIPKTLLPLRGDTTILDTILANLAAARITEAVIVVGHAASAVEDRLPAMKERHGLDITLLHNDRPQWNNAYSLWLARNVFASGAMLVNGDTVHPVQVEHSLLAERSAQLRLTIDTRKSLTDEAMKVTLDGSGAVGRITKLMPVSEAAGEYVGTGVIAPEIAGDLAAALEATWRADQSRYYEDGFQLYADRGGRIIPVDPGPIEWVEVDDHADLARAREIACHC
jgi:choline kinase